MGAPWPSCPCPSHLHTQLCFPSEPIFNRFPQRHYQELPPNHNSPLTRTCFTVPSFGDSPHSSPLTRSSPTSTPKELAVSRDPDVPHYTEFGVQQNYLQRISSFDCHLFFQHVNLPTTISPIKVHCNFNSPKSSSTPPPPFQKQSQETHEPICQ